MHASFRPWMGIAALAVAVALLPGCGHSHGHVEEVVYVDPLGDVEVDNQTDISGTFEDMYVFDMAPAGTALWTGNLLDHIVIPGELVYVGAFDPDFYDAEAELDLGIVSFFDVLVEGGYTTTFEVF
jgi:hypothetical protein